MVATLVYFRQVFKIGNRLVTPGAACRVWLLMLLRGKKTSMICLSPSACAVQMYISDRPSLSRATSTRCYRTKHFDAFQSQLRCCCLLILYLFLNTCFLISGSSALSVIMGHTILNRHPVPFIKDGTKSSPFVSLEQLATESITRDEVRKKK